MCSKLVDDLSALNIYKTQHFLTINALARGCCRIEGTNKQSGGTKDASGFHFENGWILSNGKLVEDASSAECLRFSFAHVTESSTAAANFRARPRKWKGAPVGAPPPQQQDFVDATLFLFKLGINKRRPRQQSLITRSIAEQLVPLQSFPSSNNIEESLEQVMLDRQQLPTLSTFAISNKHFRGSANKKALIVIVVYCNSILEESYADHSVLHCKLANFRANACGNGFGDLTPLDGGPLAAGVAGAPVFYESSSGYVCIGYVVEREKKGTAGCLLWGERLLTDLKNAVCSF